MILRKLKFRIVGTVYLVHLIYLSVRFSIFHSGPTNLLATRMGNLLVWSPLFLVVCVWVYFLFRLLFRSGNKRTTQSPALVNEHAQPYALLSSGEKYALGEVLDEDWLPELPNSDCDVPAENTKRQGNEISSKVKPFTINTAIANTEPGLRYAANRWTLCEANGSLNLHACGLACNSRHVANLNGPWWAEKRWNRYTYIEWIIALFIFSSFV